MFLTIISSLKDSIIEIASRMPYELGSIFISMLPIFELRGGIPVSYHIFKMPFYKSVIFSIIGNIIPVLPLLFMIKPLSRIGFFKRFFESRKERGKIIERYKELGLAIFVGIPLPLTGAWTGTILAFLFNLSILKSFIFISIGVLIAAVIVSFLTLLGIWGGVIAGSVIIISLIIPFFKKKSS